MLLTNCSWPHPTDPEEDGGRPRARRPVSQRTLWAYDSNPSRRLVYGRSRRVVFHFYVPLAQIKKPAINIGCTSKWPPCGVRTQPPTRPLKNTFIPLPLYAVYAKSKKKCQRVYKTLLFFFGFFEWVRIVRYIFSPNLRPSPFGRTFFSFLLLL